MSKSMNKVISLPRIGTHRPEASKKISQKQKKKAIEEHYSSVIESVRDRRVENEEEKTKMPNKKPILPLKRVKSEFLKRSTEEMEENVKEPKFSLKQNGKLNKIQEILPSSSSVLHTERSSRSITKPQHQQQEKVACMKKELNEVISSILILKKQIKAIEGGTIQLKEQTKGLTTTESVNQANTKIEQKIEQVKIKTEWSKYEQEVLKNMKDRLKQVILHFEKKTLELRGTLERQERKIKILNQRTSIRQESINKKKQLIKNVHEKQKTANKLVEIEAESYQKKLKELIDQKEHGLKGIKSLNADEYHYQEYKKKEAYLFEQLRANQLLHQMLEIKWNSYSQKYADIQKAQKLMQMHQIIKNESQFDPYKTYFGSFQNKTELESKIKQNQARLAQCITKNKKLKKNWQQIGLNESQEQQNILNSKPIEIKTGKVKEQSKIQEKQRQNLIQMRRKKQIAKEKSDKFNQIIDWVSRLQKAMHFNHPHEKDLDIRLANIIKRTVEENKHQKKISQDEQRTMNRVFEERK